MEGDRRNAVVLGASVKGGTGWAIAEAAAKRSMHVSVGARTYAGAKELADSIGGAAIQCDATLEAQVASFADAAVEAGGPINVAILAAGAGAMGQIDSMSEEAMQRCFALNFWAPVYFVRHMGRRMADGGGIVLISSIAANNTWPGYFAYGCAKSAMQTLVRYAALEYAPRGIRVNVICPGPIQTPEAAPLLKNAKALGVMSREIPLGRPALTQEVAEAAVWLGADAAWVTGENLHVDGGMFLRRPPDAAELRAAFANNPG